MENQTDRREEAIRAELEHARSLFREKRLQEVIDLLSGTLARYSIQKQGWDPEWPHPTADWYAWETGPAEPQVWNVLEMAEYDLKNSK